MDSSAEHPIHLGTAEALRIVDFQPAYQPEFYRLNAAWIEPNFGLEAEDIQFLQNPQSEILDKGGAIWFALLDNQVVGTCGMQKLDATTYEMVRLAVDVNFQGQQIGKKLIRHAIQWVHAMPDATVILESSSQLVNKRAVQLYEKLGFRHYEPLPAHRSPLARANVFMKLDRP